METPIHRLKTEINGKPGIKNYNMKSIKRQKIAEICPAEADIQLAGLDGLPNQNEPCPSMNYLPRAWMNLPNLKLNGSVNSSSSLNSSPNLPQVVCPNMLRAADVWDEILHNQNIRTSMEPGDQQLMWDSQQNYFSTTKQKQKPSLSPNSSGLTSVHSPQIRCSPMQGHHNSNSLQVQNASSPIQPVCHDLQQIDIAENVPHPIILKPNVPSKNVQMVVQAPSYLLNGVKFTIQVKDTKLVSEVTRFLIDNGQLPDDDYHFIHKKRIMEDEHDLHWHRVENGDHLYVFRGMCLLRMNNNTALLLKGGKIVQQRMPVI